MWKFSLLLNTPVLNHWGSFMQESWSLNMKNCSWKERVSTFSSENCSDFNKLAHKAIYSRSSDTGTAPAGASEEGPPTKESLGFYTLLVQLGARLALSPSPWLLLCLLVSWLGHPSLCPLLFCLGLPPRSTMSSVSSICILHCSLQTEIPAPGVFLNTQRMVKHKQVAHRGCGCHIFGSIQNQAGWNTV